MSAISDRLQQVLAVHQQGRLAEAESMYLAFLQDHSAVFDAWHLYGVLKLQQGLYEEAVDLIGKAIKLSNRSVQAYANLGTALVNLQRYAEAMEAYQNAVRIQPTYAVGHFNLGHLHSTLNRIEEALLSYSQAISCDSSFIDALHNRGALYIGLKRYQQAITDCNQALALDPRHLGSLLNRGLAYCESGQYSEAIKNYDYLLDIQPDNSDAYYYRGIALYKSRMYAQAIANYDRTLAFNPNCARSLSNRGSALHRMYRYEEALASYDRSISINPDSAEAHTNRGVLLYDMQRNEEALVSYDNALQIDSDYADAHWNQSLSRLRIGDFEQGWQQHEARLLIAAVAPPKRPFLQPAWLGAESIAGKKILLHADQGLGDTMQFCRYAKLLAERDATVILEVQPSLKSLLEGLDGVHQLIAHGESLPDFDMHCRLTSLPLAFRTLPQSIPNAIPYISAQQEYIKKWSSKLGDAQGLRIGIVWAGNPGHIDGHYRSIAPERLRPLLSLNHQFIGLQKDFSRADKDFLDQFDNAIDLSQELHNFSDTAAIIESLDLVISVDTSVAHLAGAMGKPVWIMLAYSPDWRWSVGSDRSLWYPSARLFRQPAANDWDSVVNAVIAALAVQSELRQPA
jgi:tetratricopeptide (TPR) repeat protein